MIVITIAITICYAVRVVFLAPFYGKRSCSYAKTSGLRKRARELTQLTAVAMETDWACAVIATTC